MSERRNVGNRRRFCLPCSAPGYGANVFGQFRFRRLRPKLRRDGYLGRPRCRRR
jgi:hypothetical protein